MPPFPSALSASRRLHSGRLTGILVLLAVSACTTGAPRAVAPNYAVGDRLLPHDTLTMASQALGETRRINVYLPQAYRAGGARTFPVLYMPDGGVQEDFPHLTNTVDSLIAEGLLPPLLVVGIENTARRRDLTGPTTVASDREIAPRVGGSEAFRRFLGTELMPEIGRRYRTSGARAIVGESLAGLFILETLFEAPELFDAYIALSPSVWWNGGALVASAPAWLGQHPGVRARLYLASAADDNLSPGVEPLAAALTAHPQPGLAWVYEPRLDQQHRTIYRGVKRRALLWALQGWPR